jgi:hypothetical protein
MPEDRQEVIRSIRDFKDSPGYRFVTDIVKTHLKTKVEELANLLRQSDKKNDYMIYRLSGYLDGFEEGADVLNGALEELKPKDAKDEKPIY